MRREELKALGEAIEDRYTGMMAEMTCDRVSDSADAPSLQYYYYFKIEQISKKWLTDEKPLWMLMSGLFTGLASMKIPVSVIFSSDGEKLGVYIGTESDYSSILAGMLYGTFPQIVIQKNSHNTEETYAYEAIEATCANLANGGFLKGNPTGAENFSSVYQIDSVIKGMSGKPWRVAVFAKPIEKRETLERHKAWLNHASKCSELQQISFSETNNLETTSHTKKYNHCEQYIEKINSFCEKLNESVSMGEWCVTVNFFANTPGNSKLLGGLLTSAFYGEESKPEAVHAMFARDGKAFVLVNGMRFCHNNYFCPGYPIYSTLLNSKELSVLSALPTKDTAGFAVCDHVDFDVHRERGGDLTIGNILSDGNETKSPYEIDSNELNRHCLVVGLTGSGKTNTVKSLLCNFSKGKKQPFMVIEPAKKEYWELYKLGYRDLQIYSVGSNEPYCTPLCINPFERAVFTDGAGKKKCVPIQTHIDFVYAAFKASFIMYTPMPYVLEKAIYAIYEDCGWDIQNNVNRNGVELYPTIEDLYYKIPRIVTAMGYDNKMKNDLIGSLQARINSMRLGTKGDTLNVQRSFPIEKLLKNNVVVELEDIGDDDVKAFIISLLLVNLLEYRRQQEDSQLEVRHLLLIEEAHRLLKNVQSGTGENADPRGAAVEFFCNLLAELRSKGQGFIIADQIPSKLAPDLIKNTNLKIVHRTVASEERELVGGAMHMTPEQIDSLSSLRQGVAAVYSEGDYRPKLVRSPYAKKFENPKDKDLSREIILRLTSSNVSFSKDSRLYKSLTGSYPCLKCQKKSKKICSKHYSDILKICSGKNFVDYVTKENPFKKPSCTSEVIHRFLSDFIKQYMPDYADNKEAEYCLVQCLVEYLKTDTRTCDILFSEF